MALDIKAAWDAAKEIDSAVSKIVSLAAKLKASPDKAAADLAAALDEVTKTHRVVHDAVTRYLSLVDDPRAFDSGIKPLLEIVAAFSPPTSRPGGATATRSSSPTQFTWTSGLRGFLTPPTPS
jgi:hypothetical protein